jgi:exo-1,4-beta-D-glucosaminidase
MGPQTMQLLSLTFVVDGVQSDALTTYFGIRQVTSSIDDNGNRLYKVNGQNLLVRGAGWSPELFLRTSITRQVDEFTYVRDMNLNAIRLEGKMENDEFFDIADLFGVVTLPGWCCCDAWQNWGHWTDEQYHIAQGTNLWKVVLYITRSYWIFFYHIVEDDL